MTKRKRNQTQTHRPLPHGDSQALSCETIPCPC
jgi:hypothetical protein